MVRQVFMLQVVLVVATQLTAASGACVGQAQDVNACSGNALPHQGRALLQVVSRESPSQHSKTPVLENYVENELLPQAEATRQALQTEMDTLYSNIEGCHNVMTNHSVDTQVEQTAISLTESRHRVCDVAQQKKIDDKEKKCGEVKSLLANMKVPPSLESIKSKATTEPEAVIELLLQQYNFFTDYYPTLGEAQEECKLATEVFEKHGKTCEAEMADLAVAICALKNKLHAQCSEYEECYNWRVAAIKPEVEKVKKLEEHNKNEFTYRTCFGVDNCDQASVDVSRLSVKYPPMPAKGTCIQGIHTKFSYPDLVCGATVVATTPAPEVGTDATGAATVPVPAENSAPAAVNSTAPADSATAPVESTTAAAETTASPTETSTMAPVVAEAPSESAAVPVGTTAAPVDVTAAPAESIAVPVGTTVAPQTTAAVAAATTAAPSTATAAAAVA